MDKEICFFEPNRKWASRLMDYWSSHGLEQYTIHYYSDEKLLLEQLPFLSVNLWVLDVRLRERLANTLDGKVLWLTEAEEDVTAVFKFRSAEVLLQTILGYLDKERGMERARTGTQLICFFTPIRRSLQTTFAITLAHLLSEKGRTLYLNLESYSGFEYMLSNHYTKDISDFIYHFNHSKDKNPMLITNFIYKLGAVDMIPPVLNPANLLEITGEMWDSALTFLGQCGNYDHIVLDVGHFVGASGDILKMSHIIFSLVKNDELAVAKWQQYHTLLETLDLQCVLDRTYKMVPPHFSSLPKTLEAYTSGVFTDYVKEAAREVGLL